MVLNLIQNWICCIESTTIDSFVKKKTKKQMSTRLYAHWFFVRSTICNLHQHSFHRICFFTSYKNIFTSHTKCYPHKLYFILKLITSEIDSNFESYKIYISLSYKIWIKYESYKIWNLTISYYYSWIIKYLCLHNSY